MSDEIKSGRDVISVEVTAFKPHVGKTVTALAIAKILHDAGLAVRLTSAEAIHPKEGFEEILKWAPEKIKELRERIVVHITETNDRPRHLLQDADIDRSEKDFIYYSRLSDEGGFATAISEAGGTLKSHLQVDDKHGVATASFPLPEDHWLTAPGNDEPPAPWRDNMDDLAQGMFTEDVREAAKYALRAATMNGKTKDLDPDALIQNLITGLIGERKLAGEKKESPMPKKAHMLGVTEPSPYSESILSGMTPEEREAHYKGLKEMSQSLEEGEASDRHIEGRPPVVTDHISHLRHLSFYHLSFYQWAVAVIREVFNEKGIKGLVTLRYAIPSEARDFLGIKDESAPAPVTLLVDAPKALGDGTVDGTVSSRDIAMALCDHLTARWYEVNVVTQASDDPFDTQALVLSRDKAIVIQRI